MKRALVTLALMGCCAGSTAHAAWTPTAVESVPIVADSTIAQDQPIVEVDGAGGVLVLWRDARTGVLRPAMQRLRFDGERFPGWPTDGLVLSTDADSVSGCVMVSDSAGGAIVAWSERRGANPMIYAQHVLASGQRDPRWPVDGLALATGNSYGRNPAICTDGTGGAFIAWEDSASAVNGWDVRARRVTRNSSLAPGPVAVCTTVGDQTKIALLADTLGGAFLAWRDARTVESKIYGAHLRAGTGEASGMVDGTALVLADRPFKQGPQLLPNGDGGILLIWGDASWTQPASYPDQRIHAQRFNSALQLDPSWPSAPIFYLSAPEPAQTWRVSADGAGGVLVAVAYFSYALYDTDVSYYFTCGGHITRTGTETPYPFPPLFSVPLYYSGWLTRLGPLVPLGREGALLLCPLRSAGASSGIDLFALRMLPDGSRDPHWLAAGNLVSSGDDYQDAVAAVPDGTGGAIAVWSDNRRPGLRRLYAQRIERFGRLGQPGATITSLRDIANDQGGKLRVSWNASRLDVSPANTITRYEVWRRDGATWVLAGSQPARQFAGYSMVISTPTDSTAGGAPATVLVRAVADDVAEWWDSWTAEGWSVDNIAPLTPTEFASQFSPGNVTLSWRANLEADLAGYRLYGGRDPDFTPGPLNFVAQVAAPSWSHAPGTYDWYKLQAVDAHGNGSGFVATQVSGFTGVAEKPRALAFAAPGPNPASTGCQLRFALPAPARVTLAIYDAHGRSVRTLVDGEREAGEHAIDWNLHDGAGGRTAPGLYFVRLTTSGKTFTRRLVVLD